jgi:hypothetical protein
MTITARATREQTKGTPFVSIALLTVLFVGAYFALRALPAAQCGFLHYEEVVNADGSVEFCATNHAGFLDMTRLKYPVEMKIALDGDAQIGQPVDVALELFTISGDAILPHDLAITHTEKMHVMIVDASLVDYHHVHPKSTPMSGRYTLEFTPQLAGTYQVFAELVPQRTRRQVIATGEISVPGSAAEMTFKRQTVSIDDGLRFDLGEVPQHLHTGVDYRFDLDVTAADGSAIALEVIMGAKGHMVGFDAAGKGFAHMHPLDSVVSARSGLGVDKIAGQELAFLFNVPNPGWYRLFAQVKVGGREVFGHFDLEVE